MDRDLDNLVAVYVAGILGIGYGLRQIIAASRAKGATIETVTLSGGAGRHPLVRQLLADCTGVPLAASLQSEPVMLGAAMLGASACGAFPSLEIAMAEMSDVGETYLPAKGDIGDLHDRRFAAFEMLQSTARAVRNILETGA